MVVTGLISRLIVLDIDFRPEGNGGNTLEFDLEIGFLPSAPVAHSPHGGYHVFFEGPDHEVATSRRQARLLPGYRR